MRYNINPLLPRRAYRVRSTYRIPFGIYRKSRKGFISLSRQNASTNYILFISLYRRFICRTKNIIANIVVTAVYPITGYMWESVSAKSPFIIARSVSTACTKGSKYAIFLKVPPTNSRSNHTPESQADKFVSKAPHIPPTCFTLNMLPHKRPREI